jgi:hypothetical protein
MVIPKWKVLHSEQCSRLLYCMGSFTDIESSLVRARWLKLLLSLTITLLALLKLEASQCYQAPSSVQWPSSKSQSRADHPANPYPNPSCISVKARSVPVLPRTIERTARSRLVRASWGLILLLTLTITLLAYMLKLEASQCYQAPSSVQSPSSKSQSRADHPANPSLSLLAYLLKLEVSQCYQALSSEQLGAV